jgi:hypothetical protein
MNFVGLKRLRKKGSFEAKWIKKPASGAEARVVFTAKYGTTEVVP